MKNVLCLVMVTVAMMAVPGCTVRQSPQDSGNRRTSSMSNDPFLGIDYAEDDIGRADPMQGSTREARPDPMDPMEQFFQQGGFANIMANPAPPILNPETELPPQTQPAQGLPLQSTSMQTPVSPAPTPVYRTAAPMQPMNTAYPMTAQGGTMVPTYPMNPGAEPTTVMSVADDSPQHVSLIYPSPEYGILKLDKVIAKEANVGQPFTYSIIVTNLTNTTLTNIVLTEEMAIHFQLGSVVPQGQRLENQIMWRVDALGPKASERIEISGVPTSMDPLKHCTSITYAVQACSNIHVVKPELELARKVPSEALLCDLIAVEYTVQNVGTGAARNVQLRENLPAGLLTENGNNALQFEAGTLLAGQSRTFTARLRASRTGVYVNKAQAESTSNIRAESVATATTVRQPILEVAKQGPPRLYLGRPASYEITVTNRGDGVARDTLLEDMLPAGVTGVEASAGADITGAKLMWQLGTIPAGTAKTVRVSYKPSNTGVLTSTATASAYCTEPVATTVNTSVIGIPAVRLDVVDLEDPVEVGGVVTYVLTVINEGSAPDRNIRLVCHLEENLTYISSSGPTQASNMGRTLNFGPLPSLTPGEKATWRVKTRASQAGGVRFRVTMSSDQLTRPVEHTEATFLYE